MSLPVLKTVRRAAMAGKHDDLYYDQVEGFRPSLDKRLQPQIAQAWAVMKEIRVGLPKSGGAICNTSAELRVSVA